MNMAFPVHVKKKKLAPFKVFVFFGLPPKKNRGLFFVCLFVRFNLLKVFIYGQNCHKNAQTSTLTENTDHQPWLYMLTCVISAPKAHFELTKKGWCKFLTKWGQRKMHTCGFCLVFGLFFWGGTQLTVHTIFSPGLTHSYVATTTQIS